MKSCTFIFNLLFALLTGAGSVADSAEGGGAAAGNTGNAPGDRVGSSVGALGPKSHGDQKDTLGLLLREANEAAAALHLPENLPITYKDLVGYYISPPDRARTSGRIGNVTTHNFTYYCSVGWKLSFVEAVNEERQRRELIHTFSWPMSRLDTNAAYHMATQWLKAISIDVEALNRDCRLHIEPTAFRGPGDEGRFVPLYWVYWTRVEGPGSAASVEFFAPSNTLLNLRVEESRYILRTPLKLTNLDLSVPERKNP